MREALLSRHDAELGYVLSLLRGPGEDRDTPILRLASCDVLIEPTDLKDPTLRTLLRFVQVSAMDETPVSYKLAATVIKQDEAWLVEQALTVDTDATDLYAREISRYTQADRLGYAAAQIQSISTDDNLTTDEKRDLMQQRLSQIDLADTQARIDTIVGMDEKWLEAFEQRQEDIRKGKIRIAFPSTLKGLNGFVPYLFPGDMVLITGESGVGKSSFGGQIFDGNIERTKNVTEKDERQGKKILRGIRFRFEDSNEKAGARRLLRMMEGAETKDGRKIGVDSSRLMAPVILRDYEYRIIELTRQAFAEWGQRGIEVFCYGWDMERTIGVLRKFKTSHDIDFAVFDYLNKAHLDHRKLRNYGLFGARGHDAELIKTATEELGIITFLIQQENPQNGMPFETTMSLQKSQVWISLQRELLDTGERTPDATVWIRKANMGRTQKVPARFDGQFLTWRLKGGKREVIL